MKKAVIILILISLLGLAVWFFIFKEETYTPETQADERFGFLIGGGAEEMQIVRDLGGGWVRPHPGPFIWGNMQPDVFSSISFRETDKKVKEAQESDLNLLVTLWHYNQADQMIYSRNCRVQGQEFVEEFGDLRCPPANTNKYSDWVEQVVERYDGDGIDDMPGLNNPVKYWEVMNEPDLQPPTEEPDGLQFWKGTAEEYAELLKISSQAIRQADPEAKILIAGAAGNGEDTFDFYRAVFEVQGAIDSFDIANIHCISSGDIESFNVGPYLELLEEYGIDKPVWVTEAESFVSKNESENAAQLKVSTIKAINLGAEKIFYTSYNFDRAPGGDSDEKEEDVPAKKEGFKASSYSTEVFKDIFSSI